MTEPKARYLASVIAGADDDTQSEGAAAELDILRLEVERLRAECAEWKAKYDALRLLVKRHVDGILAALIKTEVSESKK